MPRFMTNSHNKTFGTYFRISSTLLVLWVLSSSTRGESRGSLPGFYSLLESGNNREIAHPPKGLITCSTLVGGATDKVEVGPVRLNECYGGKLPLFTENPRRVLP